MLSFLVGVGSLFFESTLLLNSILSGSFPKKDVGVSTKEVAFCGEEDAHCAARRAALSL
jgi:hypothetical protein